MTHGAGWELAGGHQLLAHSVQRVVERRHELPGPEVRLVRGAQGARRGFTLCPQEVRQSAREHAKARVGLLARGEYDQPARRQVGVGGQVVHGLTGLAGVDDDDGVLHPAVFECREELDGRERRPRHAGFGA
jgi:hypothetical protein